jgi:hypothetical protein
MLKWIVLASSLHDKGRHSLSLDEIAEEVSTEGLVRSHEFSRGARRSQEWERLVSAFARNHGG